MAMSMPEPSATLSGSAARSGQNWGAPYLYLDVAFTDAYLMSWRLPEGSTEQTIYGYYVTARMALCCGPRSTKRGR